VPGTGDGKPPTEQHGMHGPRRYRTRNDRGSVSACSWSREVPTLQCSNEFEAAFNGAGLGLIYNQVLTPEGGPCGREVCDEGEGSPTPHRNLAWPARVYEAGNNGGLRFKFMFCLNAHSAIGPSEDAAGTSCTFDVAVSKVGHAYEFRTLPIADRLTGLRASI